MSSGFFSIDDDDRLIDVSEMAFSSEGEPTDFGLTDHLFKLSSLLMLNKPSQDLKL